VDGAPPFFVQFENWRDPPEGGRLRVARDEVPAKEKKGKKEKKKWDIRWGCRRPLLPPTSVPVPLL